MAINFTANPPVGNTVTSGNTTWTWNGTSWVSGAALTINADTLDSLDSTAFVLKTDTSSASLYANGAFIAANSGGVYANGAFTRANNSLNANSGGTISNTVIISSANASTSITTGALQISSGGAGVSGNLHIGTGLFTGNTFSSRFFAEKANVISSGLAANNTYRLLDGVVHYHTANSSANSTANLTGFNDIPAGNSVSMAVLVTNNTSPKYITTVQIDGTQTNVTIKWQGGSAPTSGATSNVDVYSFSVIKTAAPSTYTIFASKTQFG
jgi:hypothetical protein